MTPKECSELLCSEWQPSASVSGSHLTADHTLSATVQQPNTSKWLYHQSPGLKPARVAPPQGLGCTAGRHRRKVSQ